MFQIVSVSSSVAVGNVVVFRSSCFGAPNGKIGELGAIMNFQLGIDMMQMNFGGAFGYLQSSGDFLIGQAFGGKRHHLPFAWGQQLRDRDSYLPDNTDTFR
jgi:hypothetical protein